MAVSVMWDGVKLVLSEHPRPRNLYPQLDRLTSKLKRRGYRIERTGTGWLRYAHPTSKVRADLHPRKLLTVGLPVEWDG